MTSLRRNNLEVGDRDEGIRGKELEEVKEERHGREKGR